MKKNNVIGIIALIVIVSLGIWFLKDKTNLFSAYDVCENNQPTSLGGYDLNTLNSITNQTCYLSGNYIHCGQKLVITNKYVKTYEESINDFEGMYTSKGFQPSELGGETAEGYIGVIYQSYTKNGYIKVYRVPDDCLNYLIDVKEATSSYDYQSQLFDFYTKNDIIYWCDDSNWYLWETDKSSLIDDWFSFMLLPAYVSFVEEYNNIKIYKEDLSSGVQYSIYPNDMMVVSTNKSIIQNYITSYSCTSYDNETLATCYDLANYTCKSRNVTYDTQFVTNPCVGNETYTSLASCESARNIKRGCAIDKECTKEIDAPNDCSWSWKPHKRNETGVCGLTQCEYVTYPHYEVCSSFSTFMQSYRYIVFAVLGILIIGGIFAIIKKK